MATEQEIRETKHDMLNLYIKGKIDRETYNAWVMQASTGKIDSFEQA